MKIFLDDIREAPEGWVHVPSVNDAMYELFVGEGAVTDLSLDHDLGDYECQGGDGIKLVLWLAEQLEANGRNYWPTNKPTVHSANPVGRRNMEALIERYGPYETAS